METTQRREDVALICRWTITEGLWAWPTIHHQVCSREGCVAA